MTNCRRNPTAGKIIKKTSFRSLKFHLTQVPPADTNYFVLGRVELQTDARPGRWVVSSSYCYYVQFPLSFVLTTKSRSQLPTSLITALRICLLALLKSYLLENSRFKNLPLSILARNVVSGQIVQQQIKTPNREDCMHLVVRTAIPTTDLERISRFPFKLSSLAHSGIGNTTSLHNACMHACIPHHIIWLKNPLLPITTTSSTLLLGCMYKKPVRRRNFLRKSDANLILNR